jgi:hypothetical protein
LPLLLDTADDVRRVPAGANRPNQNWPQAFTERQTRLPRPLWRRAARERCALVLTAP